jgi:hypothetical protein
MYAMTEERQVNCNPLHKKHAASQKINNISDNS